MTKQPPTTPPINCKIISEQAFSFLPSLKCWLRICPTPYFRNTPHPPCEFAGFFLDLETSQILSQIAISENFPIRGNLKNSYSYPSDPPQKNSSDNPQAQSAQSHFKLFGIAENLKSLQLLPKKNYNTGFIGSHMPVP